MELILYSSIETSRYLHIVYRVQKRKILYKTYLYPIPRIDDFIVKLGVQIFVSTFDLLKGYWQILLTERTKEISAFMTSDGHCQYKVMSCGKILHLPFRGWFTRFFMTFKRCEAYIDNVMIYSGTWNEHLRIMRVFFDTLAKANFTVNLAKSDIWHAAVEYSGHKVGQAILHLWCWNRCCFVSIVTKTILPLKKSDLLCY